MRYLVISDIHGSYEEFTNLLKKWNPKQQKLIILGDFISRGRDSLKVLRKIMELREEYEDNVIVLMGNHEYNFLLWLNYTDGYKIQHNCWDYTESTIKSMYKGKLKNLSDLMSAQYNIKKNYRKELNFMATLDYYYDTEHILFVHAGVNLDLQNWEETRDVDFIKIRETFYKSEKSIPNKLIVFGHTPTPILSDKNIRKSTDDDFILYEYKGKLGVDGGCTFGGFLFGVELSEEGKILNLYKEKSTYKR